MLHTDRLSTSFDHQRKGAVKKGLTLIEVIISIAILGIMSIAFLSMFSSGMVTIFKAGQKSATHYEAQNAIESNISDPLVTTPDTTSSTSTLSLEFSGKTYNISGRKVDVAYTSGSHSKKVTSFTTN